VHDVLSALSLDPAELLDTFGAFATIALFVIVFAESGLLIGFFLPGDSLLFTAGVLASKGDMNIVVVCVGCFVAAVVGDQVGYNIGKRLGPALFRRPDSRIFRQEYVFRTKTFFEHHGPKTIVIARFVPIVRTFAPVLAGVGEMRYRTFASYNVVGAFVWAVGVTLAGFSLGEIIGEDIDRYLLPIIGLVVLASITPALLEIRRHRRRVTPVDEEQAEEVVEELEHIVNPDD
jgi:membrane-associated protein